MAKDVHPLAPCSVFPKGRLARPHSRLKESSDKGIPKATSASGDNSNFLLHGEQIKRFGLVLPSTRRLWRYRIALAFLVVITIVSIHLISIDRMHTGTYLFYGLLEVLLHGRALVGQPQGPGVEAPDNGDRCHPSHLNGSKDLSAKHIGVNWGAKRSG